MSSSIRIPKLLFFADFPPSNLGGGTILMSRLLEEYPNDRVIVLTSSKYSKKSPQDGRLACKHIVFPITDKTGPWGLGRLKVVIDYFAISILCLVALWIILRQRIQVILSVAHGHFFLAAALVSSLTGRPLILAVHDDWVGTSSRGFILWKPLDRAIFRWALHHSAHVYAIGPYMQEWLQDEYGIVAELQAPAIRSPEILSSTPPGVFNNTCPRIIYTGSWIGATVDSIELLLNALQMRTLQERGVNSWEVYIYSNLDAIDICQINQQWNDPRIHIHGWVSQDQLAGILTHADILFLPHSFDKKMEAIVRTSLPTKTADYLASGRPILVFAPACSSLARYARAHGFAEVVEHPMLEALTDSIARITQAAAYREKLCQQARKTFQLNHNLKYQRDSFYKRVSTLAAGIR